MFTPAEVTLGLSSSTGTESGTKSQVMLVTPRVGVSFAVHHKSVNLNYYIFVVTTGVSLNPIFHLIFAPEANGVAIQYQDHLLAQYIRVRNFWTSP